MCLQACDTQIQLQLALLAHFWYNFLRNHAGAYFLVHPVHAPLLIERGDDSYSFRYWTVFSTDDLDKRQF